MRRSRYWSVFTCSVLVAVAAVCLLPQQDAQGRIRLESICTVYGQKEIKLTGIGLVVGLRGTGDGGKNKPAMQALQNTLRRLNNPAIAADLTDAKNVAMVLIEATIPRTGLRRGQTIDCYVSSIMGAKSLRGGRLLRSTIETGRTGDDIVRGFASGPVRIEGVDTVGRIPSGVVLEDNFILPFISNNTVTLMLDASHASFHGASEVARVINTDFSYQLSNQELARAVGPGVVEVTVPGQYWDAPVDFVAQVLEVGIENPHTQARVVVNSTSETVIVTGEVEISPVVIAHKSLTVRVGGAQAAVGEASTNRFVPIDQRGLQESQQLQQLVQALNRLQVPTKDVIDILRLLHRSGKLHAEFDEI